jgi:hypothetical protein
MTDDQYIPGVCNIGKAEVRRRWAVGWAALIATVVLWGAFVALRIAPPWRLLTFVPAAVAAIGFLQAAWHFCAKFGLGGVFNIGPKIGATDTVEQAEDRRKDRRRALVIIGLSLLIGGVVAAASYFVPL